MIAVAAVIALLLFIYVNRAIQNRKENSRDNRNERREQYLNDLFEKRKQRNDNVEPE